MTALTQDRNTPVRSGDTRVFPVKGSTTIFTGALVAVDANDLAVPMSAATGLKGVGRAEERVDNSGGSNGDKTVTVRTGIFRFNNSASADAISQADIGDVCYGVDDNTVAKTDGSSSRSPAGAIFDVDAQGVWVETY